MLPLALFQRDIPSGDLMLVSPFSQGVTANPPAEWFHRQQRVAAQTALVTIIDTLIKIATEHKSAPPPTTAKGRKHKESEPVLALDILRLISPIIEEMDDKVHPEFNRFINACAKERKLEDFLNVYYARQGNKAVITCGLINTPALMEGRFARKKTLAVVTKLIRAVLGLGPDDTSLDAFTAEAQPDAQPRMSAVMGALQRFYHQVNPILEYLLPTMVVDLGEWQTHLMRFPAYTATSMRANTPIFVDTASATPKSSSILPSATPTIPSARVPHMASPLAHTHPTVPMGMGMPSTNMPGQQAVTIPGARMPDGSQAPPVTMVPTMIVPGQPRSASPTMMSRSAYPMMGSPLGAMAPNMMGGMGPMGGAVAPGAGMHFGLHPGQPVWRR